MKQLRLWLGLIVSAICVYFALQGISWDKVGDSFSNLNWWWIALSYIPYTLIMVLKITRWQVLLFPDKVRFTPLFSGLCISYLWNTVLPARLGEIVRCYVVSFRTKIGFVRVLSTILLEKILDVTTNIIFLLCLLPFLDVDPAFRTGAFIFGGTVVVGVIVACFMAANRRQAEAVVLFFLKPLPQKFGGKLFGFVGEVLDSLTVLLNPRLSFNLIGQSLIMWCANIFTYWLVAWAINLPLTFPQAVLVMVASNLGMAVPSAPGYIGVFEIVIIKALESFYPGQQGLLFSYALLMHITGFLPVMVLGAYYTWREGLSLGKVNKVKTDLPDKDTPADAAVPAAVPNKTEVTDKALR